MRKVPMEVRRLLFTLAVLAVTAPSAVAHERTLMDAHWRFLPEPVAKNAGTPVVDWQWSEDDGAAARWAPVHLGDDVFDGRLGYAYFRASLPSMKKAPITIHFDGVDDNAVVSLNGVEIGRHRGWDDAFDVPVGKAWSKSGPNNLLVRVENTAGPGGINGQVTVGEGGLRIPAVSAPWKYVHLPHDYVIDGPFSPNADAGHGSLPTYPAWYEKTFTLPAADRGKDIWIEFDGVYRDAVVYFNGKPITEHKGGYTPFRVDITKLAKIGGNNVLDVHVDPRHQEGWWYEGGGIYRHVWLNVADRLHIVPHGVFVTSTVKDPLGKPSATIKIQTTIHNETANRNVDVFERIYGPLGEHFEANFAAEKVPGEQTITSTFSVPSVELWSIEHPSLYRLETTVKVHGQKAAEKVDTTFGIRTIRFDSQKGFFLNERPVKIKGTCNHQDFAGVGIAVPDTLEDWRVRKLKEMGSNAWRTAHNPPTESVLDACDRKGMLVMDENRHLGDTFNAKTPSGTPYNDMSELDAMVLRDRNHPSVIMWSMCNEEGLQATEEGAKIFTAMRDDVRKLDPTRPITCAMNDADYHGIALVEDLRGFNYNPWAYAKYHEAHPNDPLYGSETGSTVSTRGIYTHDVFARDNHKYMGDEAKGYVSAYDVNAPPWAQTAEDEWQPIADKPYFAGGFVWTGFDYKGEPTPFGWPCVNSHFGIIDEAGFPKDIFYYYQSVWGGKPMAHILPHWNWSGKEGQPIDVWVFSNASRVDLLLNGKSLGAQPMPENGHLQWNVPYASGRLEALGYNAAGKLIATDKVETTGAPAALKLTYDGRALNADGEDVALVVVDVVDAHGRVVPTASNLVDFGAFGQGHIAGVGNGDPSDHDPDKAGYRHAFAGKCLVIIGAGTAPGSVLVTAKSAGLKGASLKIKVGQRP